MIINNVIEKESLRNEEMIRQYEDLIASLPKGSLICRKKEYYYLKFREDGELRDQYIGKDPEVISSVREQLEQCKHYVKMLSALKKEQKAIHKILEGLA